MLSGAGHLREASLLRSELGSGRLRFGLFFTSGGDDHLFRLASLCGLILSSGFAAPSLSAHSSVVSRRLDFFLGLGLILPGASSGGVVSGAGLPLLGGRSAGELISLGLLAAMAGGGRRF